MASAESSIEKITENKDIYVIFFTVECPYCQNALALFRKLDVPYKGYNINDINGGFNCY